MRDIANIIPTFENSKTIASLTLLDREQFLNSTLVKSPKNYTLSHFKDNESPIQQLLHSSNNGHHNKEELSTSYSTNTIKEEDEEEDIDVNDALFHMEKNDSETKVETPNFSNDSFQIIKEKPTRIRVHEVSNGVLLV
ncbi:uncharacterized protein RJT21DRAFT_132992 [Scheffersomyces amazonensis]